MTLPAKISSPASRTVVLLAGFALAVWLRLLLGGPGVAQSVAAGLVFAACLAAFGAAAGTRLAVDRKAVIVGLIGGLALGVPAFAVRATTGAPHTSAVGFLPWAVVVSIVAVAEEYYFRGALFDSANQWLGETAAVVIAAGAFAALHVPLYGWHVLPLDFAVGLWLGALRIAGRHWTAPAVAHTIADLAGWWLR